MNLRKRSGKIRFFNIMITAFLIICLSFENPLSDLIPVFANSSKTAGDNAEEKVEYVSDVKLFYSMDSRESAIKNCQNNGYIPINADLNEGTGANFVVMGYKKTYSRSDAIRSLKLLSMNDQAKIKDYTEYEEEFKKTHSSFVDTIEATANEFIVNYEEGSPKAMQAFDVLNLINIPEKDNMLLGNFIVSGEADHSFFEKIVFNSSVSTINSIFTALNYGTSAYNNEVDGKTGKVISQSWADLVKDNYLWEELEEDLHPDELKELDAEYEEDAKDFHKHLQIFATNYENALASYDSDELDKEIDNLKKEEGEDLTECDVETTACQSATIISMYETLNEYEVYNGYPLGEFLVDLGIQTSDEVDLRSLYPILDSMTYGQRMAMRTGGVEAIINTIGENKEYDIIDEKVAYAQEGIEDVIGTKSYSVWMNSNENVRGKKVAYTSEAERDSAAQKLIDKQPNETFEDTQAKISTYMQIASGALAVVIALFSVPAIASAIGTAASFVTFALSVFCYSMGLSSLGAVFLSISGGAKAAILGFTSMAGTIGVVIAIIVALVTAVLFVVGLLLEKSEEDDDLDYDEVPDVVADSATGANGDYLAYYDNVGSVEDPNQEEEPDEDDIHGVEGIGDVNGRMGFRGWNCLFMSKDPNTGSPIVANHGRGPFMILNNVSTTPRGYDSARTFGESGACNCNSYMKKDLVGGIFIYYLTEDSIKDGDGSAVQTSDSTGSSTDKNETKQYFKSMIVASADTEAKAKAKLRVKEAVYIWDHNLADVVRYKYSRNEKHCYTYLGYTITSNPKKAITDIRVSTFMNKAQASSIIFGEVSYGCAGTLGYPADSSQEDKDCPQDLDGLWYTTDSRAGTPIEVSGLHLKSSHYDTEGNAYVDKGWVPVTTFSGVPYNFGSTRDVDAGEGGDSKVFGYRYTCYQTRENNTWNSPSRYLYYEPEVKYTDGTKYLSAVFFTFGNDYASDDSDEIGAYYHELVSKMRETPNTVVRDDNLASTFVFQGTWSKESNQKYLNIGYSWSYNPYRALTDIKAFQGTVYFSELPYCLNKPYDYKDENGNDSTANMGYAATTVISQRKLNDLGWMARGIGPENAYMAPNGLLGYNTQVAAGATSYKPGGYQYSTEKMPWIATGLYVEGPTDKKDKITLNDIIITNNGYKANVYGDGIYCDVKGEKTLAGKDAEGKFSSVQEMKAPFVEEPFNLAYPAWMNNLMKVYNPTTSCFIFLRTKIIRKKYISKISVGAFSVEDAKMERSKAVDFEIAKRVDLNALVAANQTGTDEVIPANVSLSRERTWYGTNLTQVGTAMNKVVSYYDSSGAEYDAEYDSWYDRRKVSNLPYYPPLTCENPYVQDYDGIDRPAAYLSVSRTDSYKDAVKGIILYRSDAKVVPEHIKIQDVDYYCASVSTPIKIQIQKTGKDDTKKYGDITFKSYREEKYFLYYTYSTGATPGQPITDVFVDENIFISGMSTAICANSEDVVNSSTGEVKKAKLYGNLELPCYIHAIYEKSNNMVFNKLYAGEGNTRREALAQLLEQDCTDFVEMDLNEKTKNNKNAKNLKYVYLGYRGYTLDTDAIKKERTEEAKKEERDRQFSDAIYDIVCTVDEEFHPEGIISEKNQLYYTPVCRENENGQTVGVDFNSGTSGAPIYMYYCTSWMTDKYNSKIVDNGRKIRASSPQDIFSAPITRICFTEYDRVPYLQGASADSSPSASKSVDTENQDELAFIEGLNENPWEYVLYSNSKTPVDLNDGAVLTDIYGDAENNKISMFVQRYDGSVKPSAEITGGYVDAGTEIGEMWLVE